MSDAKRVPFLANLWDWGGGSQPEAASSERAFQWPTLFEESKEMMEASILVYALADLRGLWRMGKLSASDEALLLHLPLTVSDVMTAVHNNLDALKASFGANGVDFYLSSLESTRQSLRHLEIDASTGEATLLASHLVIFDDENSSTELVYGIAVNAARKRITVGFRGSVTLADFMTDAKSVLIHRSSPIAGDNRLIGIHHGFHDYLFGIQKSGGVSKCQKIMDELVELVQQYPGYMIYTTGHSLGGALSTLFALKAAADPRIPKPVSCVSIASPKVGSLSFRQTFQSLEQSRQLRCLRIANFKDLVTLLPDRGSLSCLYIVCCQANIYRHVGMELKLYSSSKYGICRSAESKSYMGVFLHDWGRQIKNAVHMIVTLPFVCCCREDFLKYHGCSEYMERIAGNGRHLQHQYLNDLYDKSDALPVYED